MKLCHIANPDSKKINGLSPYPIRGRDFSFVEDSYCATGSSVKIGSKYVNGLVGFFGNLSK